MKKMIGVEQHLKKLRAIRDVEPDAIQVLLTAGELVRQTAMESIREGTIRGAGHIASLPGEPPKGDTAQLELGIEVRVRASEKTVEVASTAPYSFDLEFGHSNVAERPFMRPAMAKHRSRVVLLMAEMISGKIGRVAKYRRG